MIRSGGIAAIVLAAGKSSRMGRPKPLLPFGSETAIERLLGSVTHSQVEDIVVVTGHDPDGIIAILDDLGVRHVHNPRYESGMLSSVLAGVAALKGDGEAFLVLPADYPLVRTEVLDRLIAAFREGRAGILHPSCCKVRGHPPLDPGRLRDALLTAEGVTSLREFFSRYPEYEAEVEVDDITILMDMDTEEDYRRLSRFAGFLDAAADREAGPAGSGATAKPVEQMPSTEDALYILSLLQVPEQVVRHCRAVAAVGETLALALRPHVPDLDPNLVRTAGLLHDVAKAAPKHAVVGGNILANLGLSRLAAVVSVHMVLPPEQAAAPLPTEEQLLYLADKLLVGDEVTGVEGRAARALLKHGHDTGAVEGVRRRIGTAEAIRDRVEAILQRPLDEVLSLRETSSSI